MPWRSSPHASETWFVTCGSDTWLVADSIPCAVHLTQGEHEHLTTCIRHAFIIFIMAGQCLNSGHAIWHSRDCCTDTTQIFRWIYLGCHIDQFLLAIILLKTACESRHKATQPKLSTTGCLLKAVACRSIMHAASVMSSASGRGKNLAMLQTSLLRGLATGAGCAIHCCCYQRLQIMPLVEAAQRRQLLQQVVLLLPA